MCNWVVYPGDKQGTIWVHLKSCCREERKEYNGAPCFWLPQGRGGEQRGPDSTHPVYSFSFVSQNLLGSNYRAGEVRVFGISLEGRDINMFL